MNRRLKLQDIRLIGDFRRNFVQGGQVAASRSTGAVLSSLSPFGGEGQGEGATEHAKSSRLQPGGAILIRLRVLHVLAAINFNDQAGIVADEVDNIGPHHRLATEFESQQTSGPQVIPEQFFRIGGVLAQVSGELLQHAFTLTPDPSPV